MAPAERNVSVPLLKAKLNLQAGIFLKMCICKHLCSCKVLMYLRKLLQENGGGGDKKE